MSMPVITSLHEADDNHVSDREPPPSRESGRREMSPISSRGNRFSSVTDAQTCPVGVAVMQTVVNKTFDEIAAGDAASTERTLQARDVRAWAAAFGEGDRLAGPHESQAAAGIVTGMLTALVGSALPGPGSSIRLVSMQVKGALPIAAAMTARLVVDRQPGPNQIREKVRACGV